jgi:hypothetical protein
LEEKGLKNDIQTLDTPIIKDEKVDNGAMGNPSHCTPHYTALPSLCILTELLRRNATQKRISTYLFESLTSRAIYEKRSNVQLILCTNAVLITVLHK